MATKKKVASKPTKKVQAKKNNSHEAVSRHAAMKKRVAFKSPAVKKSVAKKSSGVKQGIKKTAVKPVVKKLPVKNILTKSPEKKSPVKEQTQKNSGTPKMTKVDKKPAARVNIKKIIKPIEKPVKNQPKKETSKPAAAIAKPVKNMPVSSHSGQKQPMAKNINIKKITVPPKKSSLTYQPEFTKSLLDREQQSGPVYRYSDAELLEFRDLILKKLETAKKELVYLQGLITRKDEAGTDDTENKYMSMEDGSGTMEREQLNQMASRQIQFIDHLEKALMRIENKTYGICRITGKLIDKARLRAVPHATLSIEAKQSMNK